MEIDTMEMDVTDARKQLEAYRSRKHADAEAEYSEVIKLLEVAAKGSIIVNAADAIVAGGFDDKHRPRLAIARADRKQVRVHKDRFGGDVILFDAHSTKGNGPTSEGLIRRFRRREFQGLKVRSGYATVPLVPPHARPRTGQLRDWYILWEVDVWHDRPVVDPPVDPWLLRHLGGEHYEVLSRWDLTAIERAAMRAAAMRRGGDI